jgi:predicted ATPase/DNA-binding SARP family transcriptional activator
MTHLTLSLLGGFHVALDGEQRLNFESDKARALLAYLVVEQTRPHERAKLAALFWPEQNDRSSLRNLTQTLSRVRKASGDREATTSFFLTTYQVIQFNPASQHQLDVAEFTRLMATNLPALMETAVALYRGEFLAGFHLPDCPEFESWLLFRREHLHRLAMEALSTLADASLAEGAYAKAADFARRQLELDNLHEAAYRRLMEALTRGGHRAAALAQYQKCRELLDEELGATPEDETEELLRRILDNELRAEPSQRSTTVARLLDSASVPSSNLPHLTTPLLGRSSELEWMVTRLGAEGMRLITLIGPGGSGKTRLAIHAAHALQPQFQHGVYFVSLVAATSLQQVIGAIADGLRLTFQSAQLTQAQLIDCLRNRHLLLILDNFEHLAHSVAVVEAILQGAPRVSVLVTSRERLHLHGEQLFVLGGLKTPESDAQHAEIAHYGAIQLFVQSAHRSVSNFVLDSSNSPHIARIVRLLDGLPLAIELAAAWVRVLHCQTIADEIEKDLDFLTANYHNFPERHRSLRAVFDYSWQLASADEQAALRRLAVFAGRFSRHAAAQIAGVALSDLLSLLDKSLLQSDGNEGFRWHPLIHQYAQERLEAEAADKEMVYPRYSRYYQTLLNQWALHIIGRRQKETLQAIEKDLDNILAILPRIRHSGDDVPEADMAVYTLYQFYRIRGRLEEFVEATEQGIRLLEEGNAAGKMAIYWQLLAHQACALIHISRYDQADMLLQRILPNLQSVEYSFLKAFTLKHFAMLSIHRGRFAEARRLYELALSYFQNLGDLNAQADILNSLGVVSNDLGDFGDAIHFLEESITLNRRVGNVAGSVYALSNRGASAYNLERYAEAQRYHQEALQAAREVEFRPGIMLCLLNLADVAIGQRDYAQASELALEGLALTMKNHDPRQAVWARSDLGLAALGLGDEDAAHEHFCRAIATGLAIKVVPRTLEALAGLAQWRLRVGRTEEAAELLGFCLHHPNLQRKIRDRANRLLAVLETSLDAVCIEAAYGRGRAQTLEQISNAALLHYNGGDHSPIVAATDSVW